MFLLRMSQSLYGLEAEHKQTFRHSHKRKLEGVFVSVHVTGNSYAGNTHKDMR